MATPEGRVVAFIDIGTNSIRLLLVRLNPNRSYTILTQLKQMVRLGEGAFISQHLQPDAVDRAVFVARTFAALARSHGAREIITVATAATREAENQETFVARLRQEAQLDVRVVSGLEEARLIYLGVSNGVHVGDKPTLFLDIGGGSTEVSIGTQHQYAYLDSLRLGAIRLTMRFLPNVQGPIPTRMYELIRQHIRHHATHTLREMRGHHIALAIGTSGSVENLTDIAMRIFHKRHLQPGDVLTYAQLKHVVELLGSLPLEERRKVPGLNPERADIIMTGAAILDTFMQELQLTQIRFSEHGLREGLLINYLITHGYGPFEEVMSVRTRSVLQLGRTCHFDETHARTTTRLALDLFDSAREIGLHRFGSWERELLEYAALLHHIGALLSFHDYHMHTSYFIRNVDLLGFDQREIAIMAAIALYHRKALPRKKHAEFALLDTPAQHIVRVLSVLLRLAENLDRSHASPIRQVQLCALDAQRVVLHISAAQDCHIELWGVQKQLSVFEKIFERQLEIHVAQVTPEPATAGTLPA